MNEYESLDYDAPIQPTSLLMFTNDSDYMSPHFSLNNNRSTLSPFDHSFPSSNASGADENNITHLDRPSSQASNYPSPALSSSPQPTFDPSPRLSVNFGNMSPNWKCYIVSHKSATNHVTCHNMYSFSPSYSSYSLVLIQRAAQSLVPFPSLVPS